MYSNVHLPAPGYLAEKQGNLQQLIDVFVKQRQFMRAFMQHIVMFSADDGAEYWNWYQVG